MDAYPNDYIVHNLPLVLLSGIAHNEQNNTPINGHYPSLQERGTAIESDFPLLTGPLVNSLRAAFFDHDASDASWRAPTDVGRSSGIPLKIKAIGRSYRLPPQKAAFPSDADISYSSVVPIVHSPISPLTPGSPTFPDGILTPLWVFKHQELLPAAVINVYPLTSDASMSTLRDNQLKIELRDLKESWIASGYHSRFVVILVAEDGISSQEVEDRIANIRRATNLDPRSLHVVYPDLSVVEVKDFVRSFLSSLQAPLVDYYRDLSKHARRKRNRGTIPPPTVPPTQGTSQTLSSQGWNVRYEFKLGVFAEFRQEMEAAQRNFETAYETLFGQEVFESIAGWNPRFNEARLLGDILAIRIIRCLLWTSQPTAAVRFWLSHKTHTEDIVSRKGKGTKNYGWEAWNARWATVMAQIISKAELPAFSPEFLRNPERLYDSIFHPPEKGFSSDGTLLAWEYLHHQGYWLDRAARHTVQRYKLAEQIPEEHRVSTDQSPASHAVAQSQFYDTYLAPDPAAEAPRPDDSGFDHNALIIQTLRASLEHFAVRDQVRKVESLTLEIAQFHIKAKQWQEAYDLLKPLWPHLTWRKGRWWSLMNEFAWTLRSCAVELQDIDMLVGVHWEILSKVLPSRPDWDYNFHRCLDGLSVDSPIPTIVLKAEDVVPCLSASLVFQKGEGNVGQALQLQLAVSSHAHLQSTPIRLSEVKIVFEGSLRPITIQAEEIINEEPRPISQVTDLRLRDSTHSADSSTLLSPTGHIASMIGQADLSIRPSETRVFNMIAIPREPGEAQVASVTLAIEEKKFNLLYVITKQEHDVAFWWKNGPGGPHKKRIGKGRDTTTCKILPKPPNILIQLPDLKKNYYTNERVSLTVAIQNNEEDAAEVAVQFRVLGQSDSTLNVSWPDDADEATDFGGVSVANTDHLKSRSIGTLAPGANSEITVILSNTVDALEYDIEISAHYYLISDPETPIAKSITASLAFVRPFEANYEFNPRIHPDPWPNLFHVDSDTASNKAGKHDGLQQRWCVSPKIVSFASEPLVIKSVSIDLLEVHGGARCEIGQETLTTPEASQIQPEELRASEFILNVSKSSLEDRRSVTLDLLLNVEWRRAALPDQDDHTTVSSLAVPRLLIPMGEPRVLASASSSKDLPGLLHLEYILENPSMHTLTFSLTMDPSEHFAFSGAKTRALQLVPLSRHKVQYNIFAFKSGMWVQPNLVVVDTYFNKTLRVLPTEGMRTDKKGLLVWVDAYDS